MMENMGSSPFAQPGGEGLHGYAEGAPISVGFYLRAVWRRKWLVLLLMVLITGGGAAYTYFQPPVYESAALMAITSRSSGAFRSNIGEETTGNFVNTQMQLIMRTPFLNEIARDPELALARSAMFRNERDLGLALKRRIRVSRLKKTDIIRVGMEGEDKRLITRIVNTIADRHRVNIENNREANTAAAVQEQMKRMADIASEINVIGQKIWSRANRAGIPGLTFGEQQKDAHVIVSAFDRRYTTLLAQRAALRKQLNQSTADLASAETQFDALCDSFMRQVTPTAAGGDVGASKKQPPGPGKPEAGGASAEKKETAEGEPGFRLTAAELSALHKEINKTRSQLEKARATAPRGGKQNPYVASLEKKLGELMGRREAFLREFRRRQYEAQQAIAEQAKVEDRVAKLSQRIEQIKEMLDMKRRSLTPEGFSQNPEVRALQNAKAMLEGKYETERSKLRENIGFLQRTLAEAPRIQQLEDAAERLEALRLTKKIYEENADKVQSALNALSEPRTDILNEAAKLDRLEEAHLRMEEWVREVKLALSQIRVTVYDATEPTVPIRPVWSLNMAFSSMLGVMVSFGMAVVLEFTRKTFKTPTDVRRSLAAFSLGVIPHIRSLNAGKRGVLSLDALNDADAAEIFSDIRFTIHSLRARNPAKTILVTSATAGEGKSTVATLLAHAFARSGERVLLVDGNIRQPYLHAVFKCEPIPGLDDLLHDRANDGACFHHTHVKNLVLMPAGLPSEDGMGSIQPGKFAEFARAASETFDRVILDTTSSLGVADVRVMATAVDAVLYVIQADRQKRTLISRGMENLRTVQANILGVILNNAEYTKGDHYHYLKRVVQRNGVALKDAEARQIAAGEDAGDGPDTEGARNG